MYDEHLESFRTKTKVRGNTLSEKLAFVLNRWDKVVKDSEDDTSMYRVEFSKVHQINADVIRPMVVDFDEVKPRAYLGLLIEKIKNSYFHSHGRVPAGALDGICYIICELELVISGQQDV